MSKRLILIGAGSLGREVVQWCRKIPRSDVDWELAGFLDDTKEKGAYVAGLPILGHVTDYEALRNDVFVCTIATCRDRMNVIETSISKGWRFTSLVAPSSFIGDNVEIGEGSIISPLTSLTCDVKLGRHVFLNFYSNVGHDAVIGDFCTMYAHSEVTGWVRLGKGVMMGTHSAVTPKVTVGDFAVIGAGSVAFRNVRENATVLGVPAKEIFRRK